MNLNITVTKKCPQWTTPEEHPDETHKEHSPRTPPEDNTIGQPKKNPGDKHRGQSQKTTPRGQAKKTIPLESSGGQP